MAIELNKDLYLASRCERLKARKQLIVSLDHSYWLHSVTSYKKAPGVKSPFPDRVNEYFRSTLLEFKTLCGSCMRECLERDRLLGERSQYIINCMEEFKVRFGEEAPTWPYQSKAGVITLPLKKWVDVCIILSLLILN